MLPHLSRVPNEQRTVEPCTCPIHRIKRRNVVYRTLARVLIALMLTSSVSLTGCGARKRLDENLCPSNEPVTRNTILLLDTSDTLTAKHLEELRRLVKELQEPSGSPAFRVAEGEALIVYELPQYRKDLVPVMKVCNPGDRPDEWSLRDDLTKGRMIALRNWQRFSERVEPLFEAAETEAEHAQSPIIETLGVIVPRHAPSSRRAQFETNSRTHVIVFSDLLQNSGTLSHYGPYPPAKEIGKTAGLRQLQTDLTGIEVSLFRLERGKYARWQSRDHYYWWTELITSFGGRVIWQESI